MTGRRHPSELEILVLAALCHLGDDAYGVRVRREIEKRTDRNVSIGAVYTTLHRLEQKGWVRSYVGEPSAERGGRAKRYFRAEPEGRRALEETLSTFASMTEGLVLS